MIFYFGSFRDLIGPAKPVRMTVDSKIMIFCMILVACECKKYSIFCICIGILNSIVYFSQLSLQMFWFTCWFVSSSVHTTHSVFSTPVRSFKCPYWSIVVISYHFHFFRYFGNFFLKIFIGASIVFILVFCNKYFTVRSIASSFYLAASH